MTVFHNFMAADLLASLAAVCLFPLFVFVPGYAAAWLLDLFDFRRRSLAFRAALSIPLSIGLMPVLSYLVGRFGSMNAVWAMHACLWIYAATVVFRNRRAPFHFPKQWLFPIGAAAVWAAVALFSSIDLQLGGKVYYSTTALDYSVRTQFIRAISAGGIPPHNPFFFSGHADVLRYHYFWLIPCSLVDLAGGSLVTARHAWIGGTVWCGFGLIALVALFFRLFAYRGPESLRRRTMIGILLLGITGLDILPTAFLSLTGRGLLPTVEWWNEQVDGFTWTALWEAHHLSALIAALIGFLLLWEAPSRAGSARWKHAVAGGVALATSLGASIYIGLVFGVFLAVWTIITIAKKWRVETAVLAVAGAVSILLALPYLASVQAPSGGAGGGAFPFQLAVRRFLMVDRILIAQGLGQAWRMTLVNSALLPLNYILELGFFLAASVVWWRKRSRQARPLSRIELAAATMTLTSLLICTFLRSTVIENNDLGWRGFLIAQFGMLLWAADLLADKTFVRSAGLTIMLALGAAGTVYDIGMLRLYPVLADRGAFPHLVWMSADRRLGERNYAMREAYEWAQNNTPSDANVQYDPHVVWMDAPAYLYSNRQIAAADSLCMTGFGGDPAACSQLLAKVKRIYPDRGTSAPSSSADACGQLPVRMLFAKDTDVVWADRNSWVWRQQPAFANKYARVFDCAATPQIARAK